MRWGWMWAAAVLVAGCSSSGHVSAVTTPAAPSSSVARPGGLVGVIDAARVATVCANARAAQTMLTGGIDVSSGRGALLAAAGLLERPPVDPTAAATAATIRADLRRGRADAAVTTALAFCRSHGG